MTEYHYEDSLLTEIDLPPNIASSSSARTTKLFYDAAARVNSVERAVDANQYQMRVGYSYDGFSQLRRLSRLKNLATVSYDFDYDVLGRQTSMTDPLGRTTGNLYEPYCKRYAQTTARGVRRNVNFDSLCRLTQVDVGDPDVGFRLLNKRETRTFEYDELSRLIGTKQGRTSSLGSVRYAQTSYGDALDISGDGGERTYQYDELDRPVLVTFEDGSTLAYSYDDAANKVTVTENASATTNSPHPRVTRYEYWDDGLLKKVVIERPSQPDREFVYHYDSIGRLEKIVYPSDTDIEAFFDDGNSGSGWDANGRLKHMRYEKNGTPLRSFEFDYDQSGNRTLQIDTSPAGTYRWEYKYDWLDRLTEVWKKTDTGALLKVSVYTYDESDYRTKFELPQDILEFVYSYDEAGQVAGRTKKHTGGATIFTETFTHDLDGNLTGRERNDGTSISSITYEWNDFDRLIAVSSALNGTPTADVKQESLYGVNGFRRKKKGKNGNVTLEYADGLATAVAKSVSVTTYIQAHGIVGFERDGDFYYFLTDALGSVRDIVRGTDGAVLQSYDYTENGEKTASTSLKSDKTWVGGLSVNDDTGDSGLYLMGHRHYDAGLGRFLSRDPIGFSGGLNLYSYAGNRPSSSVDPAGLFDWSEFFEGAWEKTTYAMELLGYAEIAAGAWFTHGGTGMMTAAPVLAVSGGGTMAAPPTFAAGAATATGGLMLSGIGVVTVGVARDMRSMMSQADQPCPSLKSDPYHPKQVAKRTARPRYEPNPKHNPQALHKGASPEPADSLEAYLRSIRADWHEWWSRGSDGWYRYFANGTGADAQSHFSGSFKPKDPSVPNHVKKFFK